MHITMMKLSADLLKYARFYCKAIEKTLNTSVPQDVKNNINNIVRNIFNSYENGNVRSVFQNLSNLREIIFPESGNMSIRPEALSSRFVLDFLDDSNMWEYLANIKQNPEIGPEDILAAKYIVEDLKDLVNTDGLFNKESEIN